LELLDDADSQLGGSSKRPDDSEWNFGTPERADQAVAAGICLLLKREERVLFVCC